MENTLKSLLPNWYALLQGWALDGSLTAAAQEALLLDGEPKALKNLVSQWAAGDYSGLPPIVLLSSADINGAKGAYAISTGTIYLNADWLATATQEAVNAVLTEELGHYLDGLLNTVDTSGDEGEYFSDLLREVVLTDSQKSFLRAENDGGSVKADGTTLGVEFATTSPVKEWTQLLGPSGTERARSVATASDGSIYITGYTTGNLDGKTKIGWIDAFLSKYNSNGSKAWTQLLGSSAVDEASSVATASDGSIYIAGYTWGNLDGKTNSGFADVFLSKYNSNGSKAWTQLLGSSAADDARSVATASDGSIYIAGYTYGNLDGKTNSGFADVFLSKYNSNGSKAWTQLLGSSAADDASSVTTASDGSIYITGYTFGNLDGKTNSGGYDAFLSKYNSNGSKAWTQLLGLSAYDEAHSVTTASDGSIYIAGYTGGNLDAKTNSGVNDVFLSKFNGDGSKAWTQLLGSSAADDASSVTTASDGSIYITGYTYGNLDGKTNSGDTDAFISKFSDADIFKVPIVTLAVSPASVLEDGTTSLIYTFSRTGPTTNALTVNYSIAGTANAADYTGATPGTGKTITFAANSATATLTIDPTADSTIESDETVVLTLASGTGYTIGTAGAVTGTITNDDVASSVNGVRLSLDTSYSPLPVLYHYISPVADLVSGGRFFDYAFYDLSSSIYPADILVSKNIVNLKVETVISGLNSPAWGIDTLSPDVDGYWLIGTNGDDNIRFSLGSLRDGSELSISILRTGGGNDAVYFDDIGLMDGVYIDHRI
jgi:uncharacterized delta-60 repeat protein